MRHVVAIWLPVPLLIGMLLWMPINKAVYAAGTICNNVHGDPWMPHVTYGDINDDGYVDMFDAIILAKAYNSGPGAPNWNPLADVNGDGMVNREDAALLQRDFGKGYAVHP